jgi:hypothetical protein
MDPEGAVETGQGDPRRSGYRNRHTRKRRAGIAIDYAPFDDSGLLRNGGDRNQEGRAGDRYRQRSIAWRT